MSTYYDRRCTVPRPLYVIYRNNMYNINQKMLYDLHSHLQAIFHPGFSILSLCVVMHHFWEGYQMPLHLHEDTLWYPVLPGRNLCHKSQSWLGDMPFPPTWHLVSRMFDVSVGWCDPIWVGNFNNLANWGARPLPTNRQVKGRHIPQSMHLRNSENGRLGWGRQVPCCRPRLGSGGIKAGLPEFLTY